MGESKQTAGGTDRGPSPAVGKISESREAVSTTTTPNPRLVESESWREARDTKRQ